MMLDGTVVHTSLVAAVHDATGAIGHQNRLPWPRLRGDFLFLKWCTTGQWRIERGNSPSLTRDDLADGQAVVVMGRKTFESIGERALPHRLNVVLSRASSAVTGKNASYASSLPEALWQNAAAPVYILGGAQVYQDALFPATDQSGLPVQVAFITHVYGPTVPFDTVFARLADVVGSRMAADLTEYVARELKLSTRNDPQRGLVVVDDANPQWTYQFKAYVQK